MNVPFVSSSPRQPQGTGVCPRCGATGKAVKRVTLESLLKGDALTRSGSDVYRFCPNERCEVVYFAEGGGRIFPKSDLNVRVGIKETVAPRPVCYCFNHTIEEINDEIRLTGKTAVQDDIKTRMRAACWCETKNPQGSCCLSTVTRYVKAALNPEGDCAALASTNRIAEDCCVGSSRTAVPTSDLLIGNAERFSMIGSLVFAVFASACCWLPLLLLALGVSGSAVGAVLGRYRSILLSVSFALLSVAFYFTYRARPKLGSSVPGKEEPHSCDTDGHACCTRTATRKWAFQRPNRPMLWVVTALVLAFALVPNYLRLVLNDGASRRAWAAQEDSDTVVIAVDGMSCDGCAKRLQKELSILPGVESAEVCYEKEREAVVHLAKRNSTAVTNLVAIIRNAGYRAGLPRQTSH